MDGKGRFTATNGAEPDHVTVDETVIQPNDERYWLYAAVDPDTNRLLHMELFLHDDHREYLDVFHGVPRETSN